MSKVLIVGYGSIGKRHEVILRNANIDVDIVSRHLQSARAKDIRELQNLNDYSVFIIASETYLHFEQLNYIEQNVRNKKVLIEKPMGCKLEITYANSISIAYNLRFHSVIENVVGRLSGQKCLHANLKIGRNLKNMRKYSQDYTSSYSCFKEKGGGVLKDFSHDLDLALHLFGRLKKVCAHGGKVSSLVGDSDDCVSVLAEFEYCSIVSMQLSYIDHMPSRIIKIDLENESLKADMDRGVLYINDKIELSDSVALEESYKKQWNCFYNSTEDPQLCKPKESNEVEKFIDSIEESLEKKQWIKL